MTNQRSIEKALQLVRKVAPSVAKRKPAGFRNSEADAVQVHVAKAVEHLAAANTIFTEAEARRG
jgi:hypothetical protein